MTEKYECKSCERTYSTKGNLQNHYKTFQICEKMSRIPDKIPTKIDNTQMKQWLEDMQENEKLPYQCISCDKHFSNKGNVNRHIKQNKQCMKWIYLQNAGTNTNIIPMKPIKQGICDNIFNDNDTIVSSPDQFKHGICDNIVNNHDTFVAPPDDGLIHIIWNVFLTNKLINITPDLLKQNNITRIIAILPNQHEYDKVINFEVDHKVMVYQGHSQNISESTIQEWKTECEMIDKYNRLENKENILVFCNNGYQRSVPFLSYYLMHYHSNECPSLQHALNIILPQLDKQNFAKNSIEYHKNLSQLSIFNK